MLNCFHIFFTKSTDIIWISLIFSNYDLVEGSVKNSELLPLKWSISSCLQTNLKKIFNIIIYIQVKWELSVQFLNCLGNNIVSSNELMQHFRTFFIQQYIYKVKKKKQFLTSVLLTDIVLKNLDIALITLINGIVKSLAFSCDVLVSSKGLCRHVTYNCPSCLCMFWTWLTTDFQHHLTITTCWW